MCKCCNIKTTVVEIYVLKKHKHNIYAKKQYYIFGVCLSVQTLVHLNYPRFQQLVWLTTDALLYSTRRGKQRVARVRVKVCQIL